MGLLGWIVVGLVAGSIAQSVTGLERRGCLFTLAIGMLGGVVGGSLFNLAGSRGIGEFGLWSMVVAFVGACAVSFLVKAIERR
jgi:uncharacterized membrane protein YeaQ/YmgE (transglycosylase-associated protein family)